MDHHIRNTPLLLTTIATIFFFILTNLAQYHCDEEDTKYSNCSRPYMCGGVTASYPFWDGHMRPQYCGRGGPFKLSCDENKDSSIQMGNQSFFVHNINILNYTIKMGREDIPYGEIEERICSKDFANTSLDPTLFKYTENVQNITIFLNCSSGVPNDGVGHSFLCPYDSYQNRDAFFVDEDDSDKDIEQLLNACNRIIQVQALRNIPHPVDPKSGINALRDAFIGGFEVKYNAGFQECIECMESKGACGGKGSNEFTCYCRDGSDALNCNGHSDEYKSNHWNLQKKVIIGVGGTIAGCLICIAMFCSRSKLSTWSGKFWLLTKSNQDTEAIFLKIHGTLTLKRYKFSDIKKMTESFKIKLGQGGFGAVYKGMLPSGSLVAVKLLNASKGNNEDFMNEVASISRTSHVNVVTLIGYCLEGRKKALVYEFMCNGSLEKFIYKKGPKTTSSLNLETLYKIAIGIARGLEYLHRGCNTRILHFDIKPHNILLDENFCPKISDFGLAKLCPRKESIISMSDARGTIGYVAPEVWNRHFGGVSHKSDVYSYGMMLLEMVGGRKNINAEASHTSEIYFPHWVYSRLELGNNLRPDHEVNMTTYENEITKIMTIVGLWCVQTLPKDRPPMSRVIDMLRGSMNSLEMPPKPLLSSPTRSIPESSTS
ncbi:LEAF RUST 10 DISEASE-RESISTANCE LOCUS RECEPTOR-LIKE PROTEIN KINASE-like 2.4 [Abrus precatorius]|uniref:non-specific serine/threonine protein kinase n=1 Tax=Abrus precatorius TaxID=3816 RepID=A0A8B8LM95_ABRPR|nr:LEAF RUST 10 DISEASE-RESISTANCE LOCUS RECEPTOR-LIKE PROTEIN KINASE-like 2.4 [Abrus precatorius]